MDRATGPDREIPTYRTKEVMADLRHPIEDVHDQLKLEYISLQNENEKIQKETIQMIGNLKEEFQNQMEMQVLTSEVFS